MAGPDISVAVCVPTNGGTVKSEFAGCLADMIAAFHRCTIRDPGGEKTKEVHTIFVSGSILPDQRQRLVAEAWGRDCTHILWLDSDMSFPADTIAHLLSKIDDDHLVVGANYARKGFDGLTTSYVESEDYIGQLFTKDGDKDLVQVKHLGFGCVMMHIGVLDAIELPFFKFETLGDVNVRLGKQATTKDYLKAQGEDVYFCAKLREAGIKLWVDQELSQMVYHVGDFKFTNAHAVMVQDLKQRLTEQQDVREAVLRKRLSVGMSEGADDAA